MFNRTSGFVTLPLNGTYFLYSQVQFKIETNFTKPDRVGYRTVVCIPPPHGYCTTPGALTGQGSPYMETLPQDQYVEGTSNALFHGGVFHLPANSQVGLVAYYSRSLRQKYGSSSNDGGGGEETGLGYRATWYHSYLGVFLVDEIPFE